MTLFNDDEHGGKQKEGAEAKPVRLLLRPTGKSAALTSELGASALPASARTVLGWIARLDGDASAKQIEDASDLSHSTVGRMLFELIPRGLVERTGTPSRPRYVLTEKGRTDAEATQTIPNDLVGRSAETGGPSQASQTIPQDETASDLGYPKRPSVSLALGADRPASHTPIGGETLGDDGSEVVSRTPRNPNSASQARPSRSCGTSS